MAPGASSVSGQSPGRSGVHMLEYRRGCPRALLLLRDLDDERGVVLLHVDEAVRAPEVELLAPRPDLEVARLWLLARHRRHVDPVVHVAVGLPLRLVWLVAHAHDQ